MKLCIWVRDLFTIHMRETREGKSSDRWIAPNFRKNFLLLRITPVMIKRSGYYIKVWNFIPCKKIFSLKCEKCLFISSLQCEPLRRRMIRIIISLGILKSDSHFYVRINKFIHYCSWCFFIASRWVLSPAIPSLQEHNIPVLCYDVGWKEGCTGAWALFLVPAFSVFF